MGDDEEILLFALKFENNWFHTNRKVMVALQQCQ